LQRSQVVIENRSKKMRQRRDFKIESNPFSAFIGIAMLVLFLVALFYLARFVFTILYYLSPILIIAALIVNYKVVLGYAQWLIRLVRRNPLGGIGAMVLSILGFPLVAAFLLGKALIKKRLDEVQSEARRAHEGEYADFEELEIEDEIEIEELPQKAEPQREPRASNQYDDFFKE
jgi:hypothetical protein